MKQYRKLLMTCLLALSTASQVFAASTSTSYYQIAYRSNGYTDSTIPNEVANAESYVAVPVKDAQGNIITTISQYVEKVITTGAPNQQCDVRGYTNIGVRAFAYLTGNQVKVGLELSYLDTNGQQVKDWWDGVGVISADTLGYPNVTDLTVEIKDDLQFSMPDQNNNDFRVRFTAATNYGGVFNRDTTRGIQVGEKVESVEKVEEVTEVDTNVAIAMKVSDLQNKVLDTFNSKLTDLNAEEVKQVSKILENNGIVLTSSGQVSLNVDASNTKKVKYQIIKSDTTPAFPSTDDVAWVDIPLTQKIEPNTFEAYPDIIMQPGQISTAHYNYKYGNTTDTAYEGVPSREDTFKYPLGNSMVIQKTTRDANNQYSNTTDTSAFFGKSNTGVSIISLTFTPEESGIYQFSLYGHDGGYGKITVNDKTTTFVNDLWTTSLKYHTTGNKVVLEAGKSYTITYKSQHSKSSNIPVSLQFRNLSSTTNQSWQLVTPDMVSNDTYIGGANKAVKYWGYIVPDESGEYYLGAYSDDGSYGYIIIDNQKVEFVENWDLQAAGDRTGVDGQRVPITLEAGKVYPIYMEWYEGCPVQKAFVPRYTSTSSDNWKDIPSNWFYASSDTSPKDDNLAYFESYSANYGIRLPYKNGEYYVAVQVEQDIAAEDNENTAVTQALYGPFTVDLTPNTTFGTAANNFILPEGLSSLQYSISFDREITDASITIDTTPLVEAKTLDSSNAKPFLDLDLSNMVVTIKENNGTSTAIKAGQQKGNFKTEVSGNKVIITPTQNVQAGTSYDITLSVPTSLRKEISYGPSTVKYSYLYMVAKGTTINSQVELKGKPIIVDAEGNTIVADETVVANAEQSLKLLEMPRIY